MTVKNIYLGGDRYDKAFKPVEYTSTVSGYSKPVPVGGMLSASGEDNILLGSGTHVRVLNQVENCYQIEAQGRTYWTSDYIWESDIKPYLKQIGGVISCFLNRLRSQFREVVAL